MKFLKPILSFVVAFFLPAIIFGYTHVNETSVLVPFLITVPLFALAGYLSSGLSVNKEDVGELVASKHVSKWVLWSAVIGFIYAVIAVATV